MEGKLHRYTIRTAWTGNLGAGTRDYRAYSRSHEISAPGKAAPLEGSSDPAFRGDPARYSPEELLLAALSGCHMLWVLHLAAEAGIVITAYADQAEAVMVEEAGGGGRFAEAVLRPRVTLADAGRISDMPAIHTRAQALCFIASSVNFPVRHEAEAAA